MSLAAQAARGGRVTVVTQLVKVVTMLTATVVLARLLTPGDYGLVAMVSAIVGVGEIFRDFGLSMAALQAKTLTRTQQSNLFYLNVGVGAALTVGCFFLAGPIASFYDEADLVSIVQVASVSFILGGISTQFRVSINRELRFGALGVIELAPYIVSVVAAIAVAAATGSYWALVVQNVGVPLIGLLLSVALSHWRPGLPGRAPMAHLLSFGVSFASTQTLSYATRNADSVGIGKVWGPIELGSYDRAFSLLNLPLSQINTPLSRVAIPVLVRVREDPSRYLAYLKQAQLIGLYLTAPLLGMLAALGSLLVPLVLGSDWEKAGLLISILALGGIFKALVQIAHWIYMSQGLAGAQLRFYLVTQPLLIAAMLCGLPWGAVGVAVAHSAAHAVYWFVSVAWASRVAGLPTWDLVKSSGHALILVTLPVTAITGIAAHLVPGPDLLRVVVGLAAGAAWFLLIYVISRTVRHQILSVLNYARLSFAKG